MFKFNKPSQKRSYESNSLNDSTENEKTIQVVWIF